MKLITGGHKSGKTVKMIRHAAKKGELIICCDHQQVAHVKTLAKEMDLKILEPKCFKDVVLDYRSLIAFNNGLAIDDADVILTQVLNYPIRTIAVTSEK